MSLNLTQFSPEGFDLGKDTKVLPFLYGLADFWTYVFEDSSTANLMLEANALKASDIYNKFLQLSTQISLEDLALTTDSQLSLVFINETDLDTSKVETYNLPSKILSTKFIANRPLLPTKTLEENIHYYIDTDSNQISFYKPLSQLNFPSRVNNGVRQYALWFVDNKVDEQLLSSTYAKLINIDPATSTDTFKNFIYGLYYLYTNGPNLSLIRKGLNLVLGIPLARDTETVLDIQTYLNTDLYIVITDLHSYVIPYGLEPTVKVGDVVNISDELASWVEVKDFEHDGDWWLNFMIPFKIMDKVPEGETRYATKGSYADYLMREYLYKHTFLVKIKTVNFENLQTFTQLSSVIKQIKPTYTTPIYVWTVFTDSDVLNIFEDTFRYSVSPRNCESLTSGIQRFTRDSLNPMKRGCPEFTHFCAPDWVNRWSGLDEYTNGMDQDSPLGVIEGYVTPLSQFRDLTPIEHNWWEIFFRRGNDNYHIPSSKMGFCRGFDSPSFSGEAVDYERFINTEEPVRPEFEGYRQVYCYSTSTKDVEDLFAIFGMTLPPVNTRWFTLFRPGSTFESINDHAINANKEISFYDYIIPNYGRIFNRSTGIALPSIFPEPSYRAYKPLVTDIKEFDFLLFCRVTEEVIAMWWVSENQMTEGWPYIECRETDKLTIDVTGPISRSMAGLGSPYFFLRDRIKVLDLDGSNAINEDSTNSEIEDTTSITGLKYKDMINDEQIIDRSGAILTIRIQA